MLWYLWPVPGTCAYVRTHATKINSLNTPAVRFFKRRVTKILRGKRVGYALKLAAYQMLYNNKQDRHAYCNTHPNPRVFKAATILVDVARGSFCLCRLSSVFIPRFAFAPTRRAIGIKAKRIFNLLLYQFGLNILNNTKLFFTNLHVTNSSVVQIFKRWEHY